MNYFSLLRKFTALTFFIAGLASNLSAQSIITVGTQPLSIIPAGNTVHIFCNGDDKNYNSIYEPDSGEVAASWWILDAQTQTVLKHREFTDRYLPFPLRVGIGYDTLYMGTGNRVSTFNVNTQEMIQDKYIVLPDSLGFIHAITAEELDDAHQVGVAISCIKDYTNPGYLAASINGEILLVLNTLISPQQAITYISPIDSNGAVAVLCEGTYGVGNSYLQLFVKQDSAAVNISVGDGGNHIFYEGTGHDSMYVTSNGTHKVLIVDLKKLSAVKSISVGTTGFNGPRESALIGNKLFVTTYDSDVREFNIETGELVATLDSKGKPEGLTVINGKLWVANAYKSKSYEAGNTIAVFDSPLAVEEYFTENKNIVFPNPAQSSTTISTTFSGQANIPVQVEVYSLTGTKLLSVNTVTGNNGEVNYTLPIQEYNLTSGTYFIRLSAGHKVQTSRLTVVE